MRKTDPNRLDKLVAEARRVREEREKTYREQALKLFPHICGRCGREFAGANLRMLTVHHKGRGIAGVYTRDIAETKAQMTMDYAVQHGFPLKVTAEPCD